MNNEELITLIQALKGAGVKTFKGLDLDISFTDEAPKEAPKEPTPLDAPTEKEAEEIKHKVEELTSLLKLSDTELLDQLFPEPKEEPVEEV